MKKNLLMILGACLALFGAASPADDGAKPAMASGDAERSAVEHLSASAAASPYLDALGATPDTARPNQPDWITDAADQVPNADPFAGPEQTDDQVQAIEGAPGDEAPIESAPAPLPDTDLDPHQHG